MKLRERERQTTRERGGRKYNDIQILRKRERERERELEKEVGEIGTCKRDRVRKRERESEREREGQYVKERESQMHSE